MLARLALVLALLAAFPVRAEVALVTGGEHADFTRLVVEAKTIGDWRFGRSADGYELILGPAVTGYDVTRAFEKIPRDRITAIWRDPDSGRLRFSLACACHAVAFEFRTGIVVIDIRSGPPPEGSAFETALDQPPAADTADPGEVDRGEAAEPEQPGPEGGYDWIAIARNRPADSAPALPLPTGEVSLDPLRDALLAQIGRGVAEGVVEVAEGGPVPKAGANTVDDGPWSRVAIGEMPGLRAGTDRDLAGGLTAEGRSCIPDKDLDVAGWGLTGPIPAQIGLGRSGMLAEFDAPVPEAILRAARFHIHLGFGAEARQYLGLLGEERNDQAALLDAMARIVDEEAVTDSPFDGQESCDTAAALWATLARRDQPLPPRTNGPAAARSFSALPPHLRRHLGPALVDIFLAAGDEPTARIVRDAILRLPDEGSPDVALMEARYHLAGGQGKEAGAIAAGVMADGGPSGPEAAVVLVEAAFRGTRQLDPKLPLALDAFLRDAKGTAKEPRLLRARVLAAAMTSDHATAFALVDRAPDAFADLWSLAVDAASDDLFLDQAARQAAKHPPLAGATARQLAERLMSLGFPDLALQWLGPVDGSGDEAPRLLAARARLALRDAPAALALLAGIHSSEAAHLRAEATLQLGDERAAAQALMDAGAVDEAQRILTWTQDWPLVGAEGPKGWQGAAALLDPPAEAPAAGPLARGAALAEESAAARATIEALLLSTSPSP